MSFKFKLDNITLGKMNTKSIKLSEYYEIVNPSYIIFKLIPHSNCRNGSSDQIAQLVNKVYLEINKRIFIENKKLFIKTKAKVSYYIYIEKGIVDFYFIIPVNYKRLFKDAISDCWRNIGMEEVKTIPRFSEKASKYALGYKKEDALSLETDTRNNYLLSKTLNVMEILEEGDKIGIVYNFIPSSKIALSSFRDYYRETIKKYRENRNLDKNNGTVLDILKAVFNFISLTIEGVSEELNKDSKRGRGGYSPHSSYSSGVSLSTATNRKEYATLCKSQIAVFSESNNKHSQSINGSAICEGFNVIEGDNSIIYKEVRKNFDILDYKFPGPTNGTSTQECANFLQMPNKELLQQFKEISHLRVLESSVPNELKSGFFRLGVVEEKSKGVENMVYKSEDTQLSRLGMVYLGSMGAGKTTFMVNNAYDIINKGHGLIVIDTIENCKLSQSIEKITPKDKLVIIDCSDPNSMQSLTYNELQDENLSNYELTSNAIAQCQQIALILDAVNGEQGKLNSKMIRFLYASGAVVFSAKPKATLKDVIDCLSYPDIRNSFIDNLNDELKSLLEDEIKTLHELTKKSSSGTLINEDNLIKDILDRVVSLTSTSAHTKFAYKKDSSQNYNFKNLLSENKVVLIKIQEDKFPSIVLRNILATFYLSKVWLSKQLLSNGFQPQTYLFFDEFYKCKNCQELYEGIFCESRKFKLTSVVALHFLNQLNPKCKEALKSSGSSYMLLQGADEKAYQDLKGNFQQFGYEVDDLLNLDRYYALTLMKTTKNYASFVVKLPKPITQINDETGEVSLIKENLPSNNTKVIN